MKEIILTILLCASYNVLTMAQDLRSMPIAQRDSLLIAIAREVVLTYGPDWYREYGDPIIRREVRPAEAGADAGRGILFVRFLYDRTLEELEWDFAAEVNFREDTGRPVAVIFGNGLGRLVTESNLRSGSVIEPMPFQRVIMPIYDFDNPDPDQVPKNIDELTRYGRVRNSAGQWIRTRPDTPPAEAQRTIRHAQEDLRRRQASRDRDRQ
jgi:hypothetical protein